MFPELSTASSLQIRKLRHNEVMCVDQVYTADKWQGKDVEVRLRGLGIFSHTVLTEGQNFFLSVCVFQSGDCRKTLRFWWK